METIENTIENYLESDPPVIWTDYRDEVSTERLSDLISGAKTLDEVREAIENECNYYLDESYYEGYILEIQSETGISLEEIENYFQENGFPWFQLTESSFKGMLGNSSPEISACYVATDAGYDVTLNDISYGSELKYDDLETLLDLLEIDPSKFRESFLEIQGEYANVANDFPSIPERIDPAADVKEIIGNICTWYDGNIFFLFDDPANVLIAKESERIAVTKGTYCIIYDTMNGAGVTEFQLTRDLVMDSKDLSFKLDSDRSYGIQDCYGFTGAAWQGSIRKEGK